MLIKFRLWVESSKTMKQWDDIKDSLYASEIKNDNNLTFLQYTGVNSFDNKEIYDCDVVKLKNQKEMYVVKRGLYGWGFIEFDNVESNDLLPFIVAPLEVVGNVYEGIEYV